MHALRSFDGKSPLYRYGATTELWHTLVILFRTCVSHVLPNSPSRKSDLVMSSDRVWKKLKTIFSTGRFAGHVRSRTLIISKHKSSTTQLKSINLHAKSELSNNNKIICKFKWNIILLWEIVVLIELYAYILNCFSRCALMY
jgi:hypothetical protein